MKAASSWKRSIALSVLSLLGVSNHALGGVSLSVSPPLLELQLPPGIRKNTAVEVTNTGDTAVAVQCTVQDFTLSPQGEVLLAPRGSTPFSIASSLSVKGNQSFLLEPGVTRRLTLQVKLPPGTQGGQYGVLVFEAFPMNAGSVAVGIRTGVLLFLVPSLRNPPQVSVALGEKEGRLALTVWNEGNTHVRLWGEVIVRTKEGKILCRFVVPEERTLLLLPQGMREVVLPRHDLGTLPPGEYSVEVKVFPAQERRTYPLAAVRIPVFLPLQ